MQDTQLSQISNFIWGVADDLLRDVYVRGKHRDVILPMTVLRRLDAVLEPTKQKVLDEKKWADDAGIENQAPILEDAAGQSFYNTGPARSGAAPSSGRRQSTPTPACWGSPPSTCISPEAKRSSGSATTALCPSNQPYNDGLGIMQDAQTAKPQTFRTGDGWFAHNLAVNLSQM